MVILDLYLGYYSFNIIASNHCIQKFEEIELEKYNSSSDDTIKKHYDISPLNDDIIEFNETERIFKSI